MTARQIVLKEPAAIFFILIFRYHHSHHTVVVCPISNPLFMNEDVEATEWQRGCCPKKFVRVSRFRYNAIASVTMATLCPQVIGKRKNLANAQIFTVLQVE
jgi:hypothetical protein